jgi:hypothetical protein
MFDDERKSPVRNIGEEWNERVNAGGSGSAWGAEGSHARLFQHPHDLDIVDMPVGVHVPPAHGNLDPKAFASLFGCRHAVRSITGLARLDR